MKGFRQFAVFTALCLMGLSSTLFATASPHTATIYFTDPDSAKWIVYNAHLSLADINKKLNKSAVLALKSLNGTRSSTERYYLDLKFQVNKSKIQKEISTKRVWFSALNGNPVMIEIDREKDILRFYLPKISLVDLGIAEDDLTSLGNAKLALNHIQTAISKLDELLPSDRTDSALNPFMVNEPGEGQTDNVLLVSTREGSDQLVASLVELHHNLNSQLSGNLKTLAEKALLSDNPGSLDEAFQQHKKNLQRLLEMGRPIGNIALFTNNQLQFKDNGITYQYVFPMLDLKVMNIQNDSVLDFADSSAALAHLNQAVNWMHNWVVSGNTPYETSARESSFR
ncbi:hypothetical protein Lrub_0493 [Legionella rubrilucens]|uniref:Uncharacterized protein n=1 Tax=Legionella rubrilucens TaxID=458 RepID=A0A0W0XYA9_9GAMM|nr:hypothetical protein [Legionella rubrilucens]KTD49394.1 hypothetical protein Lrub_0493 [Legionella rubrilucens]